MRSEESLMHGFLRLLEDPVHQSVNLTKVIHSARGTLRKIDDFLVTKQSGDETFKFVNTGLTEPCQIVADRLRGLAE